MNIDVVGPISISTPRIFLVPPFHQQQRRVMQTAACVVRDVTRFYFSQGQREARNSLFIASMSF